MPKVIIPANGGVLHLPDALARFPNKGVTVYDRVSSFGQAGGKGKPKLIESARIVREQVRKVAPGKLKRVEFCGVEEGRMSNPRPTLVEAAEYAKKRRLILIAAGLSRFIRAESYDRRTNNDARPTQKEFAQLRKLTLNVPLATILPPELTESEWHSARTKQGGEAGRKRTIGLELAAKITEALGFRDETGRWEYSYTALAKRYKVSKSAIARLMEMKVPPKWAGGQLGLALRDLDSNPMVGFDKRLAMLHEVFVYNSIVSKP